ncbi:hydrogenase expression/formation protein HypE [Nonomuraea lactucae]|uniref:hydrogenase expression/formation protein HypE n=1 Tax=Nonomuraea lactucae TaxID=2249762 RepID=UPI001F070E2C|nr:hydrogenase expression/formation protein HypE [Nonomuraea lactucae]
MAELLADLTPRFGVPVLEDAALVTTGSPEVVMSTDGFVVTPRFFPGGDIGSLAVHGTVNDLAMMGAVPIALSLAYIVEEGLPLEELRRVTSSVAEAARACGVRIVTGDTKVVGKGAADGLYVTTTGIGIRLPGAAPAAANGRPGDVVLLSGPIGLHGVTILSTREGLGFESELTSDSRPLHGLVTAMITAAGCGVHTLRDPTRGGLASALNELAAASRVGVELEESAIPVPAQVAAACDLLGLDPLHVANEGCLVAFVDPAEANAVLAAMRERPEGAAARRIGVVVADHPGRVTVRTLVGSWRVVDMLVGEQLPRIC